MFAIYGFHSENNLSSNGFVDNAPSGTPEQARPARPRCGLDFQIHNVEATYLVVKGLTTI